MGWWQWHWQWQWSRSLWSQKTMQATGIWGQMCNQWIRVKLNTKTNLQTTCQVLFPLLISSSKIFSSSCPQGRFCRFIGLCSSSLQSTLPRRGKYWFIKFCVHSRLGNNYYKSDEMLQRAREPCPLTASLLCKTPSPETPAATWLGQCRGADWYLHPYIHHTTHTLTTHTHTLTTHTYTIPQVHTMHTPHTYHTHQ